MDMYILGTLMIALVLHIIGYFSDSWGVNDNGPQFGGDDTEVRLGVWNQCYCSDNATPSDGELLD